jgi:hypothetical protein
MKKSTIITLHVVYWALFLLLNFSLLMLINLAHSPTVKSLATSVFFSLCIAVPSFYSFYLFLVPRFLAKRRTGLFLISAFSATTIIALIAIAIQGILAMGAKTSIEIDTRDVIASLYTLAAVLLTYSFLGLINGVLATFIKAFITWYSEIHVMELLAKKNLQTELALIKALSRAHLGWQVESKSARRTPSPIKSARNK